MSDNYDIREEYDLQDELLVLKDNLKICAELIKEMIEAQIINKKCFNVLKYRLAKIEHSSVVSRVETLTKEEI